MHRNGWVGWLSAVLTFPVISQARVVTEAEFLSALDDSHPAAVESAEALDLARARIVAASTLENPVLGLTREDPSGPIRQTDWAFSWQLPGADRRPKISARRESAAAETARLAQQMLSLRLTMKQIYAEWALASARHERLIARTRRVEALADRERLRAERGETAGLEARRLDLEASVLRGRVALTAAAAEQARARAAGWSADLPSAARPVLPEVPLVKESSETHPLERAAAGDLAAAQLEHEAARRFVRSPQVSLGWQRQELGSESIDGPTVGLAWSMPVLGRNRAERAAAEARVSAARARLDKVRREIRAAREGALASFQKLTSALADTESALKDNERMLDGMEAAFRHGEASLTDLLDIQRSVTESELAMLELYEATLAAYREFERATGASPTRLQENQL